MMRRQQASGFSLTELMAVVAVTAMLLALAAPSIMTLTSTSLTTGGRQLSGYLNLARAEAIRDGRVTRVILVRQWNGEPDSALRKLCICKWDDEKEEFVLNGAWQILPEGVVIEPEFPDYVRSAEYAEDEPVTVQAEFPAKEVKLDVQGDSVRALAMDFLPNGRVRQTGNDPKRMIGFVLIQGHTDDHGNPVRTGAQSSPGKPKNWAQVNVDALTGNVQIYRP